MQQNTNNQNTKPAEKQRLRLPFENRKTDPGVWSYIHRRGISITVIAYLLFAIIFLSARISVGTSTAAEGIIIDFQETEIEVPQQREDIRQQERVQDFSNVSNRVSNENAELNAELRDDRGATASELYNDAESLNDQMRANREAYEQGLRSEQDLLASRNNSDRSGDQTAQDTRVQGRVTVSFSFSDPIRTSSRLVVPAYMCEGGGEVVLNVTLNNSGSVTSATVDRAYSTHDECMQTTAVNAAKSSRFNVDTNAPAKHRGTITYIFIPQ